jgi:hypothetical protein
MSQKKPEQKDSRTGESHVQASEKGDVDKGKKSESDKESKTKTSGWTGAYVRYNFAQCEEMKDWIQLDNQSTATIFCNPKFVDDIRKSKHEALALQTNGGVLYTETKATLPQWGKVWFNPEAVTNIFSYAEMADRYRITTDSREEDAFTVHTPWKQVKFRRHESGLYVHKPLKTSHT